MDDMDKEEALIVNCDGTYPLDSVVSLLESVSKDIGVHVDPQQKIFPLSQLQAVSEEVRRRDLLCGVFVVNAYESRLSINEDRAGIGYAVLYRALLEAAQGRVLVVIGGDDRYKAGDQDTSVLSTWAYHKIAAQFDDTYLDGRRGFVFSWDERHNPVHQEALGSYLRAITSGQPGLQQPFTPTPPSRPPPEPSRPPSTSTDQIQRQTRQTDPKFQPMKAHKDPGFQPGPKKDSRDDSSETAAKYGRAKSHLPVHEEIYTGEEVKNIRATLKKHENEIMKANPRRKIKFVGHLVYGKLVPECSTPEGYLQGMPGKIVDEIKKQSSQMKSAYVIVFDDETAQNCFIVRELRVPKKSDNNPVPVLQRPLVWLGIVDGSRYKQK